MPFLTVFLLSLSNCYYPIFISVRMKSQVDIITGGIFETIFYISITSYSLSIGKLSLKTSFYQVRMILIFLGTVNAEGEF